VENVIDAEQVKSAVNRQSDAGRASNVLLGLLLGEERDYLALLLSFALVAHQGGTGTVRSAARHHVYYGLATNSVARTITVFAQDHCEVPEPMIPLASEAKSTCPVIRLIRT
jgi:hypothetical protein